jgi:predicted small integral membrane protein
MTTPRMIELAVAVLFLVAGVWLYRARKAADQGYGSQGAVLLLAVALIMAIHALRLLEYHPSQGELEILRDRAR